MQVIAAHNYDLDTRSRISTVRRVKTVTGDRGTPYTRIIQALALKFTNTTEEAEAAAREMFDDIYRYSGRGLTVRLDEQQLVSRIALRRLIKYLK